MADESAPSEIKAAILAIRLAELHAIRDRDNPTWRDPRPEPVFIPTVTDPLT